MKEGGFLFDFGLRLRGLREKHKLSQEQLGEKVNVTRQTISNWENDNIQPSIEMLVKIARVFNVSTDFLLGQNDHTYIEVTNLTKTQIRHVQQIINDILKKQERNI